MPECLGLGLAALGQNRGVNPLILNLLRDCREPIAGRIRNRLSATLLNRLVKAGGVGFDVQGRGTVLGI